MAACVIRLLSERPLTVGELAETLVHQFSVDAEAPTFIETIETTIAQLDELGLAVRLVS